MKQLALILFLFVTCCFVRPTLVINRPLTELIVKSDCIIVGEIVSMNDTMYTLKTLETILGISQQEYILHKNNKSMRYGIHLLDHDTGQIELAFLSYDIDTKTWDRYANHGESELAVKNDSVYIDQVTWYIKAYEKRYSVHLNKEYTTISMPYHKKEMIRAMIDYQSNYKIIAKKLSKEKAIQPFFKDQRWLQDDVILTDTYLLEFCNRSVSHKRLIDELVNQPWDIPRKMH
jgi:hypothetical protein